MSRTYHHHRQRENKWGLDFGARYSWNKGFGGGFGRVAKDMAHREMRSEAKKLCTQTVCEPMQTDDLP